MNPRHGNSIIYSCGDDFVIGPNSTQSRATPFIPVGQKKPLHDANVHSLTPVPQYIVEYIRYVASLCNTHW